MENYILHIKNINSRLIYSQIPIYAWTETYFRDFL